MFKERKRQKDGTEKCRQLFPNLHSLQVRRGREHFQHNGSSVNKDEQTDVEH